ncbi:shufflon system plasmid conjugative transfer pilus tip adhesin PilV [Pseudomonas sp. MWU12-2323]|uniref:shufflon system plasmid conjugative transfer pilus tip adhesin PilV n=1 Tax=Pseudomonas sp. MWU12-2323 TaxID=2651296 RepID=UPI00128C4A55|nr:shufflon system plasmid conjugative transfer pilus tip adhesin PilV [Pseudomonas sp. MWU12-2323]MPQ69339.1 shufflon system plasmid conjugative transfer pilus tip adhesin PilV [Pseudomonas sp. MWU12-2323]
MSIRRASGFTLVELAVVMAVVALLAALTTPNIMNEINQIRAKGAAEETQLIVDAARSYRMTNGSWPGNATCSDALNTLLTTSPPMLVGIGSNNKYNSPYVTSCTAVSFSLDQNAVTDWDGYLANLLGATQVVNPATNLIRTTIGIPGSEPALDSKLSRVATGNPELNTMRTDLLLGGNNINNVGAINAASGTFSGNVSAAGTVSAANVNATNVSGTNIGAQTLFVQQGSAFVGKASFNDEIISNKIVVAGQVGCDTGAIARDVNGLTLSCQSGVWKASGDDATGVGTGFMTGIPGSYLNRITGGYSCPAGLVPNLIGGVQIAGCQPCLSYSCSKP